MRKPFVAGNWKMNKAKDEACGLVEGILAGIEGCPHVDIAVCPPFTFLDTAAQKAVNTPLMIDPAKLQIIMAALAPRFGLDDAELAAALGDPGGPYATGGVIDYSKLRRHITPSGRHHIT
ncbi:hypothetical protein LCGC14_2496030, partial [marine sediment metagenome]